MQGEDCLYLNVVRPVGYDNVNLPVLVWIHGKYLGINNSTIDRFILNAARWRFQNGWNHGPTI